ncbi:acyl-CoA reductase [Parapedobacter sp. 10938]|uniref:acyl-CoA reductase n=1 Tax=Parapedobacter flavus TaxID=3110225 RepID=UPI002DB9D4B1|nr:acyl-CoA reductase [Parapedobacter sp. 10938]MEC3880400.1 acyl-CoA reductase [Parapedobacter sp. 10938]
MTKKQRLDAFHKLGDYLRSDDRELRQVIELAYRNNPWFTIENTRRSVEAIALYLSMDELQNWLAPYPFDTDTDKTVGLVLAGNIPLVGFHDILCVLASGFNVQVKTAAVDPALTPHLLAKLQEIEPGFTRKIQVTDRLANFDLVIATGSDNSSRYFNHYFGHKPHIIRKNRNSVAILSGTENAEELRRLGTDIFDYFGLGCRSVSKLFIPVDYDPSIFFEGIAAFGDVINHHKYANNYDYNKSIYLINGDQHYDNGFLLLKPDERSASPLAALYLETYPSTEKLLTRLNELAPQLQCVVSKEPLLVTTPVVRFGESQQPALDDYADGVNTLDFLAAHR